MKQREFDTVFSNLLTLLSKPSLVESGVLYSVMYAASTDVMRMSWIILSQWNKSPDVQRERCSVNTTLTNTVC